VGELKSALIRPLSSLPLRCRRKQDVILGRVGERTCVARFLGRFHYIHLMAKKSVLARNAKRERMVERFALKRAALKAAGDYEGLQKLPRNASPVRLKNRCSMTGRRRGYMRAFGLSRIKFRELAVEGKIPGVKKSSW
jgi:small subunit ribosomal protein S14